MAPWNERGNPHRINAPALVYIDGYTEWHLHGKLHRIGGPAITWPNHGEAWYEHGVQIKGPRADA